VNEGKKKKQQTWKSQKIGRAAVQVQHVSFFNTTSVFFNNQSYLYFLWSTNIKFAQKKKTK